MKYETQMILLGVLFLIALCGVIYLIFEACQEANMCNSKCYDEGYGKGWYDDGHCICDTTKKVIVIDGDNI